MDIDGLHRAEVEADLAQKAFNTYAATLPASRDDWTTEQGHEYTRLMRDAESAYGAYAERKV